jgi:hypothetical protein
VGSIDFAPPHDSVEAHGASAENFPSFYLPEITNFLPPRIPMTSFMPFLCFPPGQQHPAAGAAQ